MNIINDKFNKLMGEYLKVRNEVEDGVSNVSKLKDVYFRLIGSNGFEDEVKKCYVLCELNDSKRIKLSGEEWDYVGSFVGVEWSEGGFEDVCEDIGVSSEVIIKEEFGFEWFNINDGKLELSLMDNGDWEYDRVGFGKDDKGLFMVDVDDSGESWRVINRIKEGLSIEDVCEIGVKYGIFEKIDYGYGKNDKYRVEDDSMVGDVDKFNKEVLVSGEFNCDLYSVLESGK